MAGAAGWHCAALLVLLAGCAAGDVTRGGVDGGGAGESELRVGPVRGGDHDPRPERGPDPGQRRAPADPGAFTLSFGDARAPSVYQRDLIGRRDRPSGTQGLWVTVSGLRRAERAEVVNLATGASVKVALFRGRVRAGEARISNAAAALLGIGSDPVQVRITALRREPVLAAP